MELTKIHPGVHILYYLILICFGMLYTNIYYLATFIIALLVLFYLEGILHKLKDLLMFYIPLSLLLIILNPLANPAGETKIYLYGNFFITLEAFVFGLVMCISLLLILMVLLSYNEEISYQEMLYLFSKKFPNTSLVIVMSLRYIPLFTNRLKEFLKINKLDKENSKVKNKIENVGKAVGGVLSWSLEESMITAKSMKARGYGIAKRTSYLSFDLNRVDYVFILIMIVAGGLCVYGLIIGVGRINIYPHLDFELNRSPIDIFYIAFLAMLVPKIVLEIRERLYWVKL